VGVGHQRLLHRHRHYRGIDVRDDVRVFHRARDGGRVLRAGLACVGVEIWAEVVNPL
jgi:hypothetical protein